MASVVGGLEQVAQVRLTPRVLTAAAVVVLLLLGLDVVALRAGDDEVPLPVSSAAPGVTPPGGLVIPDPGGSPSGPIPSGDGGTEPVTVTASAFPTVEGDPAQPLPTAPAAEEVGLQAALPVGTCLIGTGRPTNVASVTPAGCEPEHTGEVYASVILTQPADAAYPGKEPLQQDSRLLCQGDVYTAYVGVAYPDSRFLAYALFPTDESWAAGDRDVSCVLYDIAGPMTGSKRDSNL